MLMNELKAEIINLFESVEMKECINSEYDSLHILTKPILSKAQELTFTKSLNC